MASKTCSEHTKYDCSEEQCKQEYNRRICDEQADQLAQQSATNTQIITTMIATGLI